MNRDGSIPGGSLVRLWGPVVAYMAAIYVLSSMSGGPDFFPDGSDKGLHWLLYTGLSFLLVRALSGGRFSSISFRIAVIGALIATTYGVTDELHQRFVAGRTFDYWDMVADALGGASGAIVAVLWGRMRHDL